MDNMNIDERIVNIKKQLGITGDGQDDILTELFRRYLSVAKKICFRQDEPPELLDIVQDIVAGAYNQRGGEGFASTGAGGQSYNQLDLYDTMRVRLIAAGLRLARGL